MNDVLKECSDKENAIASLQYVYECEIKISRCKSYEQRSKLAAVSKYTFLTSSREYVGQDIFYINQIFNIIMCLSDETRQNHFVFYY